MSEPTDPTDSSAEFAAMFEASLRAKPIERGQAIEGTIVAIGSEVAFVNVGGKGEATISIDELKNDDGVVEVKVGDKIHATVVSTGGTLALSRKLQRGAASLRQVEDAYRAGLAVEGKVAGVVKGGLEVTIARQRAFCPLSQIDIVRVADPAEHVGRVYSFRIIEFREGGKNIIVSRRALLEEEQREQAVKVRESIVVGSVVTGRVASVQKFGAFVELGSGVQGLIHVSEMGWSRVANPADLLKAGDEVEVKVLRVEEDGKKIALGLKQLTDDPWSRVASTYAVGQIHTARVTRHAEFGAFVELEAGVEGLAHVSTFPQSGGGRGWTRAIPVGTTHPFEIRSIDLDKKRLGVALVQAGSTTASDADDVKEYRQRQSEAADQSFGSLADKLKGALKKRGES